LLDFGARQYHANHPEHALQIGQDYRRGDLHLEIRRQFSGIFSRLQALSETFRKDLHFLQNALA
jgi:hypothetical protein